MSEKLCIRPLFVGKMSIDSSVLKAFIALYLVKDECVCLTRYVLYNVECVVHRSRNRL